MSITEKRLVEEQILDAVPLSSEVPCAYFTDRGSRFREFRHDGDIAPRWLELVFAKGYRRCGNIYYQTQCPACAACQSFRVFVDGFRPNRSQRRVGRCNQDVVVSFVPPRPSPEKEDLYLRYQFEQHHEKDCRLPSPIREIPFDPERLLDTMYFQMYTNPSSTVEIELRRRGQLIGFGIIDAAQRSASAVYFAFDPDFQRRSLGTFAILQGIEWARQQGIQYYYLGYYIAEHRKMAYKRHFRPAEVLDSRTGQWNSFSAL